LCDAQLDLGQPLFQRIHAICGVKSLLSHVVPALLIATA